MSDRFLSFSARILGLTADSKLDWIVLRSVGSTNTLARECLQRSFRSAVPRLPVAFVAWSQRAGRGRGDRRWESREGEGVWATLLLPRVPRNLLARLPLAAGVALAEVLQGYVDDEVRLKWPNDLCVDGAKLGGILTEGVTRGRECSAIVGFGINHGSRPPQIEGRRTTSLTLETAQPPLLADLAVALATEVHRTIEQPSSAEELVDHVRRISAHRIGDPMQLATAHGTITGRFREIDEQGLLILKTDRGVRRVAAAEVVDR